VIVRQSPALTGQAPRSRRPVRLALISLEPWDEIWRRNQHLSAQLVRQQLVESVTFIEPPVRHGKTADGAWSPEPGISVFRPRLYVPRTLGGLALLGRQLRRGVLRACDLLWVNDPTLGVHCLSRAQPAIYDVTDDWREFRGPRRIIRRVTKSEDKLAQKCKTIVCSEVLRERWRNRYGVSAPVVPNGIDGDVWRDASPLPLRGALPHVGYVGTLHQERLDVPLILRLASDPRVGQVHLVGPDAMDSASRQLLESAPGVTVHGPVPAPEVPNWIKAMDVLICPHQVSPFTLSLDAIKSYEYLASGRPIVATPTSGFQSLDAPQLTVVDAASFVQAVGHAASDKNQYPPIEDNAWATRAISFASHLPMAQTDEI